MQQPSGCNTRLQRRDRARAHLDVVLVQWLVQVVDVDVAVQGVAGGALDEALDLRAAEVARQLRKALQVNIVAQERVGAHLRT